MRSRTPQLPSGAGRLILFCLAMVVFLPIGSPAAGEGLSPEQRQQVLAEAQEAYDRGAAILRTQPDQSVVEFRQAAARFQLLIDDGVKNGRLYYNLGNACLQAGDLGRAILSYRRAERLMPGDARLQSNLTYARSLTRDQIAPSGQRALADALLSWHRGTSPTLRSWLFVVSFLLFWLLLISWLFRRAGSSRYLAIGCALVAIACGSSLAAGICSAGSATEGVVVQGEVIVRKGNGQGFAPQFEQPIHEGVEFRLLEARGGWLSIELPDGKSGWIPADAAGLIDD